MQHNDFAQHHRQPASGIEATLVSLLGAPVSDEPPSVATRQHQRTAAVAVRRKANKAARRARRAVRVG